MVEKWSEENHQRWIELSREYMQSLVEESKHQPLPSSGAGSVDARWGRIDDAIVRVLRMLREKHGCPEALMYAEQAMERLRAKAAGVDDVSVPIEDVVLDTIYRRVSETGSIAFLWKAHGEPRDPFPASSMPPDWALRLEDKLKIPHDAKHATKAEAFMQALRERKLVR